MRQIKRTQRTARSMTQLAVYGVLLVVFVIPILIPPATVFGLTKSALESINRGGPMYDPSTECSEGDAGTAGATAMQGLTISGTSKTISSDPLTLTNPTISDVTAYGTSIVDFIRKAEPNSPILRIPDIETKLINEGQQRNVNMMVIISIARQESQLGMSNVAQRNNNLFGNKGSGAGGYREWPSIEASLFGDDSFTQAFTERRAGGSHASYKKVTNLYEFLSVHVSGQIIYPGDKSTSYDDIMGESINDSSVVRYFTNVSGWIGEMTGLKISGVPTKGNGTTAVAAVDTDAPTCATSAAFNTGTISVDGYRWPVGPATKDVKWDRMPCKNKPGCHHDGTAAADLFYGKNGDTDGQPVYALTDGEINEVKSYPEGKTDPESLKGCVAIHFRSSTDKFFYWYGHLENRRVSSGEPVQGGDQIATVARMASGHSCRLGRDHLHIDRGCSPGSRTVDGKTVGGDPHRGGDDDCRDPNFIPILNKIWEALPGGEVQT